MEFSLGKKSVSALGKMYENHTKGGGGGGEKKQVGMRGEGEG